MKLLFVLILAGFGSALQGHREKQDQGYVNAVYFADWSIYARNFLPSSLPVSYISHIIYAFMQVSETGTVYSPDTWADIEKHLSDDSQTESGNNVYGCVQQLFMLKTKNRHLKVMLSIGGWTFSDKFVEAAGSETSRQTFARTAVTLMKDWGFDGIDIDWEYPADASQAENMVLLLQNIREELDCYSSAFASGYHFILSIAAPAGPSHFNLLQLREIGKIVDYVNLMGYDFAGSWGTYSGHASNLYKNADNPNSTPFNVDDAIKVYSENMTSNKIVLGMPVYGHSFEHTSGIGETYSVVGPGSWDDTSGTWDYKVLPKAGATMKYDDKAGAYYTYDESTGELISFDTVDTVKKKVDYLKNLNLGGGMFWEASADKNDTSSLITTSFTSLGSIDMTQNCIDYPNSQYDNIRNGMKDI